MNYRMEHGDALALILKLPDASIDAVITDPPYSSGGTMRSDRALVKPSEKYVQGGASNRFHDSTEIRPEFTGDNRDQRSWTYWCALWMGQLLRVVKPGGYLCVFSDWRQLPAATDALQAGGFVWRGLVVWDKGGGARAPHTGYFRHQSEFIVWGTNGALSPAKHGGPWPGVLKYSVKQDDKHHITGKPTALMRDLVKIVPPGGTILDPFAGSGTTLKAAVQEGRNAIGFEWGARNVEIARRRIAGAIGLFGNAEDDEDSGSWSSMNTEPEGVADAIGA